MKNNFQDCLQRVLKDEGGYTNDPSDSGGATNYGITIGDVRKYVKKNATPADVKALTLDQATSIYKSKYWDSLDCDSLASGVDYTCFDYGVNSGLERPRKALQRFSDKSGAELINAINNERRAFLKGLAATRTKDQKFLRGWLARVKRVNDYSLQLAQKKDNTTGPIVATTIGTATIASSYFTKFWHDYHNYVIIGGIAVALAIGIIVHYIRNKGK